MDQQFYGSTTMGEKGQVVIPAEARSAAKLKKGEKMLVFGVGEEVIILAKISNLEQFASLLSERLKLVQGIISQKNSKQKKSKKAI